jgi:hypothetical protein
MGTTEQGCPADRLESRQHFSMRYPGPEGVRGAAEGAGWSAGGEHGRRGSGAP